MTEGSSGAASSAAADADQFHPELSTGRRRKKRGHLYELDFVRLVTFAGVILDHCVSGTTMPTNVASNAVQSLLHYTRNSFFALTGFVLVYQYRDKKMDAKQFWRRRYKYIGLPFLFWSVFYWLYKYTLLWPPYFGDIASGFNSVDATLTSFKTLLYNLCTGESWYHLYFVFCTMQVYLIFPFALWFLRRTWGFHKYILAASLAFHLVVLHTMSNPRPDFFSHGLALKLWNHLPETMIPYQFFTVAGMIAAMHFDAFRPFVVKWRIWIAAAAVPAGVISVAYYLHLTTFKFPPMAANVFRPYTVLWFVACIMMLYALGTLWTDRRKPGTFLAKFFDRAADRAFGIFLVHGLALQELAPTIQRFRFELYQPIVTVVAYIATVLITVAITEVLRRSPISLVTTGREMIPRSEQNTRNVLLYAGALVVIGLIMQYPLEMPGGILLWAAGAFLAVCTVVGTAVAARRVAA